MLWFREMFALPLEACVAHEFSEPQSSHFRNISTHPWRAAVIKLCIQQWESTAKEDTEVSALGVHRWAVESYDMVHNLRKTRVCSLNSRDLWFCTPFSLEVCNLFPPAKNSVLLQFKSSFHSLRITEWPGLKRATMIISSNPLLCAGSPTSSPGCPEPHPAWPWMPAGMGHPQPPWATCSVHHHPLGEKPSVKLPYIFSPQKSSQCYLFFLRASRFWFNKE